jgi:alpha/beta hydrolase fold
MRHRPFRFAACAGNLGAVLRPTPDTPRGASLSLRGAAGRLPALVLWPAVADPGLLLFFGEDDASAFELCSELGVIVLAPQHASFDDAVAALEWAADHAAELGASGDRLLVTGRHADGLVAHARAQGWPDVAVH